MKILIRNNKSKIWRFAEGIKTKAEVELQKLLIDTPSLIPIEDIREGASTLVVAVKEFGLPGSGRTDILAFSINGDIAIIECKLAENPDSKRKVIGQVLEYASYLWEMSYEEVNSRVQNVRSKNLIELIDEAVAKEWDKENFLKGIQQSLKNGSFILIVVVDEVNEELRHIIRYTNECSESAFSLHALAIDRYYVEETEILVPSLYGASVKLLAEGAERAKWSEEKFFKVLRESVKANVTDIIKNLYEWSMNVADRIWFGTGVELGSFTFHYLKEGKTISVFTIYTNGKLMLNYGWLSTHLEKEILEDFHRDIHEISTFKHIPNDFSKWPSLNIADAFLNQENGMELFKEAVENLGAKVHS